MTLLQSQRHDMPQTIATKKGYRYHFSKFFVTCTLQNAHLLREALLTGKIYKGIYTLGFHSVAFGQLKGVFL